MKYNEYNFLPDDLLNDRYDLEILGVYEFGWKMPKILKIIEFISQKDYAILGGDVYRVKGNLLEITYDNWYIEDNGDKDFLLKSKEKAISYIKQYSKMNGDEFVYTIVFQKYKHGIL